MKKRKNRGQLKLSFGMIFSIILIIIFMAFAFFAIQKFMDFSNSAQIAKFKENLQSDIDNAWRGNEYGEDKEYHLPSKIEEVCFVDYEINPGARGVNSVWYAELKQNWFGNENMFFYPIGSAETLEATKILHINIEEITENENPYCIKNKNGKVQITIKKNYGENLPIIE